ncbi:MAG TPA: universal stress protein [Thermoanaerobaculia bacterium]|nr:universal stress protein [Thermoanaerobaculia bacterium]
MFNRILVPTDMSDFASLAMDYALFFRERLGSRITLLYADEVRMPIEFLDYPLGYYLENAPDAKLRLQQKLRDFALEKCPGGGVETIVIDDSPARAIVQTASGMNADLIIMGTHGRSGWKRAILGSVTEEVLRRSDTPVLAVTPLLQPLGGGIVIERVLCPVTAIDAGTAVADAFGAELMLMAVCDDDPPERLLALAEKRHADLIVTTSTRHHITRIAACPVLVARVAVAAGRAS